MHRRKPPALLHNATSRRDNGKVAFATNWDGNFEIYSMNADGTGQANLTNNAADDFDP